VSGKVLPLYLILFIITEDNHCNQWHLCVQILSARFSGVSLVVVVALSLVSPSQKINLY